LESFDDTLFTVVSAELMLVCRFLAWVTGTRSAATIASMIALVSSPDASPPNVNVDMKPS
jgi:hypothetical protein